MALLAPALVSLLLGSGCSKKAATPQDAVRQYVAAKLMGKWEKLEEREWFEPKTVKQGFTQRRGKLDFDGASIGESHETVIKPGTLAIRFRFYLTSDYASVHANFNEYQKLMRERSGDAANEEELRAMKSLVEGRPQSLQEQLDGRPKDREGFMRDDVTMSGDGVFYVEPGYRCVFHGSALNWDKLDE